MIRIALNGFGRIGKTFVRTIIQDSQASKYIQLVAINIGPSDPAAAAYAFKYDSIMGTYPGTVELQGNSLVIDGTVIQLFAHPDVLQLPWAVLDIEWVVEASGKFTKREQAELHRQAGARKVLITAPAHGEDITIIPGVNDAFYNPHDHTIVSLGSCTTNALMPTLKILHDNFMITYGIMSTTHAYTNSQKLLDVDPVSKDMRKSRAAGLNIVPTSTGAMRSLPRVIPGLANKIVGNAMRVPVAIVSLLEVTFVAEKSFNHDLINQVFSEAARGPLKNFVAVTRDQVVSIDFKGSSYSVTIDTLLTTVSGPLGKVYGWYDNEWGYSCRLKDFLTQRIEQERVL